MSFKKVSRVFCKMTHIYLENKNANELLSQTLSMSHRTTVAFSSANVTAISLPKPFAPPVIKTISSSSRFLDLGKILRKNAQKYRQMMRPTKIIKSTKSWPAEYFLFVFRELMSAWSSASNSWVILRQELEKKKKSRSLDRIRRNYNYTFWKKIICLSPRTPGGAVGKLGNQVFLFSFSLSLASENVFSFFSWDSLISSLFFISERNYFVRLWSPENLYYSSWKVHMQ